MEPQFDFSQEPPHDPLPELPAPLQQRSVSDARDMVLAVLLAILNALLIDTLLFAELGLFAGLLLALQLGVELWYLWRKRHAFTAYGAFCFCGALLLSVSMPLSDDTGMKELALLGIIVLSTVLLLELMLQRRWEAGTLQSVGDVCVLLFGRTFGKIGVGVYGLFHRQRDDGSPQSRRVGGLLLGVACALPVLLVVIPLLVSSDAAFAGLVGSFQPKELVKHLFAGAIGLFFALLLFSQLFHLKQAAPLTQRPFAGGRLPAAPFIGFLSMLSVVYLAYLVVQGAYFLDGFRGLLPDGYTVAEYARRGFFELCVVGVLNLGFVLLVGLLCRRSGVLLPLPVRLLACFLCVFSLALTAAAVSKLVLYIQCFGMTRPRILAAVFMVVLGCLFVAVGLRLFLPRVPCLKVGLVAATLSVLLLSYANVDRIIASYNVRAYREGRLETVDVSTLSGLSDAAVPSLLELMDDPDPAVAKEAGEALRIRLDRFCTLRWDETEKRYLCEDDHYDLRSFNTDSALARRLLVENAGRIAVHAASR